MPAMTKSEQADARERFRQAAEECLEQLGWCIDYLHSVGKHAEAGMIAGNHQTNRSQLLDPVGAQQRGDSPGT
jgi:hypothetical protein